MGKVKTVAKAVGITGLLASGAVAITTPSQGSFAYDLYDIVVEKLLKGPAGFVAGCGAVIYGAASLIMGRILPAVLGIAGGALLIKADSIAQSLGLLF
ncbi:MAG: hypothetical protein QXW80_04925 [Candidatus Micrarchaeia archaeon]